MKTTRLYSPIIAGLIGLLIVVSELAPAGFIPEKFLEGPFNQSDKRVVPSLLYTDNPTGLVTYWDDESTQFLTYDQNNDTLLDTAIFEIDSEEEGSQRILIANNKVVAHTNLSAEELLIQQEYGCTPCHDI